MHVWVVEHFVCDDKSGWWPKGMYYTKREATSYAKRLRRLGDTARVRKYVPAGEKQ